MRCAVDDTDEMRLATGGISDKVESAVTNDSVKECDCEPREGRPSEGMPGRDEPKDSEASEGELEVKSRGSLGVNGSRKCLGSMGLR